MSRRPYRSHLVAVVLGVLLGAAVLSPGAQQMPYAGHGGQAAPQSTAGHGAHQTPEGSKFTWPRGDSVKGRDVFLRLECYSCHEVRGEMFPAPSGTVGPELSAMGPLHDAAYFAEAIINPDAMVERGKGYEAADGSSKMPSYNDLVTVQEVIDVVAYLKGLRPPVRTPASHGRAYDSGGDHDEY
jgi:mono/diheme cytochrome c family protein